jgi:PAS domain-containing protein
MQYEKLTKQQLVRIIEGIRSTRYGAANQDDTVRLLEALLLERYEFDVAMQALKESNIRLEQSLGEYISLFDTAPVAYVVLDASGCILRMNDSALTVLRTERTGIAGLRFSGFLTENSRPLFLDHLTECRRFTRTVKSVNLDIVSGDVLLPFTLTGWMDSEYSGILLPTSNANK